MPVDRNIQILITDDSAAMRELLQEALTDLYFENITEAENGDAAWDILTNTKIDLLLLDWDMPGTNGLDLLKKVRADEKLQSLPVIMITSEGGQEQVVSAIKTGVSNFIVKPFDPIDLSAKIERLTFG